MASAGRVLIIPRGAWDSETEFEMLDLVTHNERAWIAKQNSVGETPEEGSEYWQSLISLPIANNLTTDIEGYLLDATQGKALFDLIEEQQRLIEEFATKLDEVTEYLAEHEENSTTYQETTAELVKEVNELKETINAMPTITSGTSEPTGGEDGDVYIMYE